MVALRVAVRVVRLKARQLRHHLAVTQQPQRQDLHLRVLLAEVLHQVRPPVGLQQARKAHRQAQKLEALLQVLKPGLIRPPLRKLPLPLDTPVALRRLLLRAGLTVLECGVKMRADLMAAGTVQSLIRM